MNKTVKNGLLIGIIVIAILGIIWILYDIFREKPVNANTENTSSVDENTGLSNMINDLFEDVETNEIDGNEITDETEGDDTTNEQTSNVGSSTQSATSKEKKAVQLVEKFWGGSEGVYFSNDGIDNQGRYRVSVHKKNTDTLAFFIVDIEKELVTKQ